MIDLSEYYSGGYFLIRAGKPDWPQLQTNLLPDKLISLSKHICPQRLSVYWGWKQPDDSQTNRQLTLDFGIPEAKFAEFAEWSQSSFQIETDFPSMFFAPDFARRFIERFLPDTHDLYLIGTGLHKSLEETNWREPAYDGMYGFDKRIAEHLPMAEGGTSLGFEVVSVAHNDYGCSWLCNYLHEDMYKLFGIRPGQYGLIETREQAEKVYEWIMEDPVHRAEPEPYDYWLLVSYPLSSQ